MRCPACSYKDSKVIDSRPADSGMSIRRRRECLSCHHRFTTYEKLGENPLVVVKSDGSSEIYNREKLARGLFIACAKRPVTPNQVHEITDSIEARLRDNFTTEISSIELGNLALEELSKVDDVASIRFASVYKDFKSVEEFMDALEELR